MTDSEVIALMQSSKSEAEWNRNADKVKAAFGGSHPEFWYRAIILSGIAAATRQSWRNPDA